MLDICTEVEDLDLRTVAGRVTILLLLPDQILSRKFLAMATGIDTASSTYVYVCIWCKCSAGEWWDISKQWSFDDATEDGSRTIEESLVISALLLTEEQV